MYDLSKYKVHHSGFYQQETVDGDLDFDVDYMSESKSLIHNVLSKYKGVRYDSGTIYAYEEYYDELRIVYEELSRQLYVSMIAWTPDTNTGDYSFRALLFDNKLKHNEPFFEKIIFEPSDENERFIYDICSENNLNTDGVYVYGYPGQLDVMVSVQKIISERVGIVHKIRSKYDHEQKRCVYYFMVDEHYYEKSIDDVFVPESLGISYVDDVCMHYGIEHIRARKSLIVKDGEGKYDALRKAAESLMSKMSVAIDMQFDVEVGDMQLETYYQVSYDEDMKKDETEIFFGGLR